MKVICAGMSKTGTKSLAKALRFLGLTVFDVEEQIMTHYDAWRAVFLEGQAPDFAKMYSEVDAVTDGPSFCFYKEILQAFPEAKVVLNVRENENVWAESFMAELRTQQIDNSSMSFLDRVLWFLSPTFRRNTSEGILRKYFVNQMMRYLFGSILPMKGTYLLRKRYLEHNERVQSVVPSDKLLVYKVTQGWGPLCQFLNCEEPKEPFPHENVKSSVSTKIRERLFKSHHNSRVMAEASFTLAVLAVCVAVPLFGAVKHAWK